MADPVVLAVPGWRIVLDVVTPVLTLAAIAVALFGQAFRAKFFPPKLTLSLADQMGEASKAAFPAIQGIAAAHVEDARYYHLRVGNSRRWSPAADTRIVLLQVEQPGPDGRLQVLWTGDIPLRWRHDHLFPLLRIVGPDTFADLCSVIDKKWLELHPLVSPHVLTTVHRTATTLVVTVQARSAEADSNVLRIRVAWDGKFHPGANEMRHHLTVEAIP